MHIRAKLRIPLSDPIALYTVNADKATSRYLTEQVFGLQLVHLCIIVQKQFLLWIPLHEYPFKEIALMRVKCSENWLL